MSTVDNLRQTGILMRRAFELLDANPGGLTIKVLLERIGAPMFPRDGEGGNHSEGILRRSCIAPLNAGWLTCRHGYHLSISPSGKSAYSRYADPVDFMIEAGRLSTKGWLSIRFPKSYYFAGKFKDQLLVEFRAVRRIGVKQLLGRTLNAPSNWQRVLPVQTPRRVNIQGLVEESVLAYLGSAGVPYAEGGHAVYLPTESFRQSIFSVVADDYPPDAGLKIVKNPGGANDSHYVNNTAKGDSRIHLGLVHNHANLTLVANLLYSKGIGPRLYDLVELQCGDQLFTAYVIEHISGGVPPLSECEAGIQKLRELEDQGLIRVILPEGFNDEEFECPNCCNNALTNEKGEFRYIDFQNFILVNYESYLKSVAVQATEASHFGDTSVLRGGRYLYQSVPGVKLPGKRSIEARTKVLEEQLESAGVSVSNRLVLDIGCNIGMMMGQYLKLGASWCHGWDRVHLTPHTEKLLLALGCTRFSTTGVDIDISQLLEDDLPPFLKDHLHGCVISYLAVRGHLGWLDALARIPWQFLIYEGHEGETREDFEQYIKEFSAAARFKVASVTFYVDGDSDERTLAILLRN
jgi:hypothetical protein